MNLDTFPPNPPSLPAADSPQAPWMLRPSWHPRCSEVDASGGTSAVKRMHRHGPKTDFPRCSRTAQARLKSIVQVVPHLHHDTFGGKDFLLLTNSVSSTCCETPSRVSSDRNACSHCSKGRILQVYMKFSKNLQTFANLWVALYRYNRLQHPTFCVSSAGLCRCSMYSIAYLSKKNSSFTASCRMAKPNPWLPVCWPVRMV